MRSKVLLIRGFFSPFVFHFIKSAFCRFPASVCGAQLNLCVYSCVPKLLLRSKPLLLAQKSGIFSKDGRNNLISHRPHTYSNTIMIKSKKNRQYLEVSRIYFGRYDHASSDRGRNRD